MNMLLLLIFLSISTINGLIGYDCDNVSNKPQAYSLIETKSCQRRDHSQKKETFNGIIIQELNPQVDVWICSVSSRLTVFRCGKMYYQTTPKEYAEIVSISDHDCVNHSKLKTLYGVPLNQVSPGKYKGSKIISGWATPDGDCGPGSAQNIGGDDYDRPVVTRHIEIIAYKLSIIPNKVTNSITIKNINCRFNYYTCKHPLFGQAFWNESHEGCKFSTILSGQVNTYLTTNEKRNTFIMKGKDRILGGVTIEKVDLCLFQSGFKTNYQGIYLIPNVTSISPVYLSDKIFSEYSYYLDLDSRITSAKAQTESNFQSLAAEIEYQSCKDRAEIYRNRLAIARSDPLTNTPLLTNEPGTIGLILGEVLYVTQCTPIAVTFRITDKYYFDLPITVSDGRIGFLRPTTKIFVRSSTVTTHSQLGSIWGFNNLHYIYTKDAFLESAKPMILDPNVELTWSPSDLSGSVYSLDEQRKVASSFLDNHYQGVASNSFTQDIQSEESGSYDLETVLLNSHHSELYAALSNPFTSFSNFLVFLAFSTTLFFGILGVISIVKNIIILYKKTQTFRYSHHAFVPDSTHHFLNDYEECIKRKTETLLKDLNIIIDD